MGYLATTVDKMAVLDASTRAEMVAAYSAEMLTLARDFLADNGLTDAEPKTRRDAFTLFVRHARKQLVSIPRDLLLLDSLFDVYLDICALFSYSANVYMFAEMMSIDGCINHWEHEYTSRYIDVVGMDGNSLRLNISSVVRNWRKRCGAFLAAQLQNTDGTSVNRIFISKAIYGLRDDGPTDDARTGGDVIDADSLPTLPG